MRKESDEARQRPEGRDGSNGACAAFFAFVLLHAGCGDGAAEYRLGERSLACWCRRCDELGVFTATDHGAWEGEEQVQKAQVQRTERQGRGRAGASIGTPGSGRGYVDAREAAEMLGVGQRAVRSLAARGHLEAKRDGEGTAARIVVSVDSVERLREERRG